MALPIGGFMPIPLAMMIPFMATQSLVMGDAFGKAYQFGKRKISAMNNEDFNKLTLTDLISEMQTDFKLAIPKIEQSIQDSTELQNRIIKEMLLILPKFATGTTQDFQASQGTPATIGTGILGPLGSTVVQSAFADDGSESQIPDTSWHVFTDVVKSISNLFNSLSATIRNVPDNPEQRAFDDLPPDENLSGAELTKAANDLAYRQSQKDKAASARGQALLEAGRIKDTEQSLRRKSIADSGLSPLAFNARETFRKNIDNQKVTVTTLSDAYIRYAKANPPAYYNKAGHDRHKAALNKAIAKLSALRTKYKSTYAEYY